MLGNYYPDRFPSFWEMFNDLVESGRIVSVREVLNELERQDTKAHLDEWIAKNKRVFQSPGPMETEFVRRIFQEKHFQQLVSSGSILKGNGRLTHAFIGKASPSAYWQSEDGDSKYKLRTWTPLSFLPRSYPTATTDRQPLPGIPHIGSLQAHRAAQERWQHHIQVLQGQSIAGLSNKRCDSCREPCFLSIFVVFGPPPMG